MWNAITGTIKEVVDVVLPSCCPLCHVEFDGPSGNFCARCAGGIRPIESPCCPLCALPYPGEAAPDHLCQNCLAIKPAYDRVLAAAHYDGVLREAIHRFKYRGGIALERALASFLSERCADEINEFSPNLVIPVPLHVSRLRRRSYNQSLLLARRLGRSLDLPVAARLLRRSRATDSQQQLSGRARRANLRGAFTGSGELRSKRLLLVDDVMTTGATVEECSRELLRCGAGSVLVAVLGRSAVGAVPVARP